MNSDTLLAWQGVIVVLVALPVLAVVITLLGRQYRRVAEARAALTRDAAYRDLAAAATAAQQQNAAELANLAAGMAQLAADLDDVKRSVATVERLLREVG